MIIYNNHGLIYGLMSITVRQYFRWEKNICSSFSRYTSSAVTTTGNENLLLKLTKIMYNDNMKQTIKRDSTSYHSQYEILRSTGMNWWQTDGRWSRSEFWLISNFKGYCKSCLVICDQPAQCQWFVAIGNMSLCNYLQLFPTVSRGQDW